MHTDLVNKGCKAVVEGLDLLLLLGADSLDGGVNLKVQRGQEAPVDCDCCDVWLCHIMAHTSTHASTKAHITKIYCTPSLPSSPSDIATHHLEPSGTHSCPTAAYAPIGAADCIALPGHGAPTVTRERAAAITLGRTPGGRHSGVGGGLHGSDRHGHSGLREVCRLQDSVEGRVRQIDPPWSPLLFIRAREGRC